MSEEDETTLIGWQGISARVPADWTLAGVGGDRRQGYVRVDYERTPRLQVKWARRHIDLERKRAEYVQRLAAGRRRRPTGLEVSTDLRVISKRAKPKKEMVTYGWRGAHCGMGVLWNCEVCGRGVMAQVGWPLEEEAAGRSSTPPHGVAQEVLESLEDHGVGGWDTWGVDGLVFLAPTEYELEGWRRMTRYLELRLARNQETLKVARWGIVPLVLGERTVREWYEEANRRRRDMLWASEETQLKGHEGMVAVGRRRRLAANLRTQAARAVGRRPAVEFEARAWHCPESNRLYLVEAVHSGGGEASNGAVESLVCHEQVKGG